MTQCLLFDFFGTLVEYQPDRTQMGLPRSLAAARIFRPELEEIAWQQAWDTAFSTIEAKSSADGREFHMHEAGALVCECLDLPVRTAESLVIDYIADWSSPVKPVPGAAGLVRKLANFYRVGLISNTHYPPMVHGLLADMALESVFECVVLSVDVGVPKPDPHIFNEACRQMGVKSEVTVYIGDSYENDYQGATGAGMDCFLIGAHARVSRNRQLRSILDLPIHFRTS